MLIGRFIHRDSYEREWKEVILGDVKLDVVVKRDGVEVVEIKKSSKLEDPAKWQLKYYLYLLKNIGVNAKGVISYPTERRRERITLSERDVAVLEEALKDIERVISLGNPPKAEKRPYCRRCAYRDFCRV